MSKTIENLKSGNYEVVDNQGVSVTNHFIECLEKELFVLEEQLKNAIVPKFKIGQEVWIIINNEVVEVKIKIITFYYDCKYVFGYKFDRLWDIIPRWEDEIFATKEEAQAKLKELQGETK